MANFFIKLLITKTSLGELESILNECFIARLFITCPLLRLEY